MNYNTGAIEKKVEEFLENSFCTEDYRTDDEVQLRRFSLLSKLVADLFNCNNSTICFKNISNLIILILNIYSEKFPIDIYSNNKSCLKKKPDTELKQILKENLP